MATLIRPVISEKNKYHINKHRHYELKHFCLQYPEWKQKYSNLACVANSSTKSERVQSTNIPGDPTANQVINGIRYSERIKLIERIAIETDDFLHNYILKAVTEELSFTYLKNRLNIPCSRDTYYDRYRKFFWLLSEARK